VGGPGCIHVQRAKRKILEFDDCIDTPCIIDAGFWPMENVT
jgi:hypothetical protein